MVTLNLVKSTLYKNNDIYLFEKVESFLLINNNYHGLIGLDKKLEVKYKIDLFPDIVVDQVVTSSTRSKNFILDCSSENNCLVLVDQNKKQFECMENSYNITPVYFWQNEIAIFSTSGGNFLLLDTNKKIVSQLAAFEVKRDHNLFFKLFTAFCSHVVLMIDVQKFEIIFKKEDDSLYLMDILWGKEFFLGYFSGNSIQIIKMGEFVFILTEENLYLLFDKKIIQLLSCEKTKYYQRIAFLDEKTLALLTTYNESQFLNEISLYQTAFPNKRD